MEPPSASMAPSEKWTSKLHLPVHRQAGKHVGDGLSTVNGFASGPSVQTDEGILLCISTLSQSHITAGTQR